MLALVVIMGYSSLYVLGLFCKYISVSLSLQPTFRKEKKIGLILHFTVSIGFA